VRAPGKGALDEAVDLLRPILLGSFELKYDHLPLDRPQVTPIVLVLICALALCPLLKLETRLNLNPGVFGRLPHETVSSQWVVLVDRPHSNRRVVKSRERYLRPAFKRQAHFLCKVECNRFLKQLILVISTCERRPYGEERYLTDALILGGLPIEEEVVDSQQQLLAVTENELEEEWD